MFLYLPPVGLKGGSEKFNRPENLFFISQVFLWLNKQQLDFKVQQKNIHSSVLIKSLTRTKANNPKSVIKL